MQNTESLLIFDEVKKNRDVIVPRIAEGNIALENILNYCIDKNMPTIACCTGHKLTDKPYITMHYNKDTRRNINGFLNRLNGMNVEIMFSTTGFTENPFNVTVYANMLNRDKVFSIISSSLEEGVEDEYLSRDLEDLLNVAIDMDYKGDYVNASIFHKPFKEKYMVEIYGKQYKGNIFEEHSDRVKKGLYGMTFYLYRTSDTLRLVSKDIEKLLPKFRYRDGFVIKSDISANEKVDRISEFNDILIEENGTIKRF